MQMNKFIIQFLFVFSGTLYCFGEQGQNGSLQIDSTGNKEKYGVVTISVADARLGTSYGSEMGTQLLMGMPLEILQHQDWWQIKTPEGYVAWIEKSAFVRMDKETFNQWISAKKVIFTDDYGFACEAPDEYSPRVSDLVFGNLLKWEGESKKYYYVSYPDGRKAYVSKKQAHLYDQWVSSCRLTENNIVQTAFTLKGIPYMWGGTSTKGMDCSGFTKTVFLKNGVILLRDASQQAKTGTPVDISDGYENLRPGDLMFFGKKAAGNMPEKVRHVAIYIGNREFIQASGYVRISSLDPDKPNYDPLNTKEFIHASRIVGAVGSKGIWNINDNPLYQVQK